MYIGLDLTFGKRPATGAALSEDLLTCRVELLSDDGRILEFVRTSGARIVAIDSPLGLPSGLDCLEELCPCRPCSIRPGRQAERLLSALGIPSYYTTKRSIIKPMVYRAMALRWVLEAEGVQVLEVYPYATKVRLWGRGLPRKTTRRGVAVLNARLKQLVPGAVLTPTLDHDACDALLCAFTAYLYARGLTEPIGYQDEGVVHIPVLDCGSALVGRIGISGLP